MVYDIKSSPVPVNQKTDPVTTTGAECKNVIFANEANDVVVFFHTNEQTTHYTEIVKGKAQICIADWHLGLGAWNASCPDKPKNTWQIRMTYRDGEPIGIEYGSIQLDYGCVR